MRDYPRWLAMTLALPLVLLAARPATAQLVVSSKSLVCGGSGPVDGSLKATRKGSTLQLKFKAKGLVPNEAVACGYYCQAAFSGGTSIPCGPVDKNGKLSTKVDLPLQMSLCFGIIPYFYTGSNGSCLASTVP